MQASSATTPACGPIPPGKDLQIADELAIYLKKNKKIRETGIPNNSRISVFTLYLSDLVYWVGFVTGVTFKTHLSNTNFIDLLNL